MIRWNPAGPSGTATPRRPRTCKHWWWPISWRTSSPFGRRSRRLATRAAAQESIITAVGHYLHVVEIVLSGIGVVALAIAALGIANALMAAVRERRREIGVLKAIGARDRDVMRTFLVEAETLGFVGGILGTALGGVITLVIGGLANQYLESQGLAGVRLRHPPCSAAGSGARRHRRRHHGWRLPSPTSRPPAGT